MISAHMPTNSTKTDGNSDEPYDMRVAQAMDRVLEAERAAQSAIVDCEKQSQALLEQARQQRRNILQRAHDRIVALHTRSARAFELQVVQVRQQNDRPVPDTFVQYADQSRLQAEIEKLADRLIVSGDEET
jgi:cell division septum initiation protein DivIVA